MALAPLPRPQAPPMRGEVEDALAGLLEDSGVRGALEVPPLRPDDLAGLEGLIGDAIRWLKDAWVWLNSGLEALRVESPVLFWLVVAGLLLVLVLLLWHIVWTFRRVFRGVERADVAPQETGSEARIRAHRELLQQARAEAAAGQHRDAVRSLNLALLALCEERAELRFAKSWTVREVLAYLRRRLRGKGAASTSTPEDLRGALDAYGRRSEAIVWNQEPLGDGEFGHLEEAALRIAGAVHPAAAGRPR